MPFVKDYFVGCVSAAEPDALSYMEEPAVPSNYKKPEVIAEFKAKKQEEFVERAAFQAVTGRLTAAYVEDVTGRCLLAMNGNTPDVAIGLLDCLARLDEFPAYVGATYTPQVRIWGFGLDQMLRIAGLQHLRHAPELMPLRVWHKNGAVHDPYEILTGSSERKVISLEGLYRYLDMRLDPAQIDPGRDPNAHRNLARVARDLCLKTGLVYYDPQE